MSVFIISLIVSSIFIAWYLLFSIHPKLPLPENGFLDFVYNDFAKNRWYHLAAKSLYFTGLSYLILFLLLFLVVQIGSNLVLFFLICLGISIPATLGFIVKKLWL